ncbi:MAG: helix-turn-helix transcriptional regulator [Phycisphaerae bacterium]
MSVQMLQIGRRRMVQMPEREYKMLVEQAARQSMEDGLPPLPPKMRDGGYPALEYARVSLARKIIRHRRQLGMSQAALARAAGIPAESLNRLERAKTNPTIKTIQKIEQALCRAEKKFRTAAPARSLRA